MSEDYLTKKLSAVRRLRDFAISSGYPVDDALITDLEGPPGEAPSDAILRLLRLERDLCKITAPWTIYNLPDLSSSKVEAFKFRLSIIGIVAMLVCVLSSLTTYYTVRYGNDPGYQVILYVMIYGAAFGLLGGVIYCMFHVIGVLTEKEFRQYDTLGNYGRLVAAPLLGWMAVQVFGWQALAQSMSYEIDEVAPKVDLATYALLLLPFLAGYSSSFVIGVFSNLLDAAKALFGMAKK